MVIWDRANTPTLMMVFKKQTVGFEVLTQPEDILTLSDANRAARQSAPIRMRIFKAGAIHHVEVTVDVY